MVNGVDDIAMALWTRWHDSVDFIILRNGFFLQPGYG